MSQADTTASFGYWIRRQRLARDLTQAELARQVGCATVTISKIERDERRPSRQMAGLLADNLAIADDERDRFLAAALGEKASDRMPLAAHPLDPLLDDREERPLSNLPASSTPFVGRQEELTQLYRRLRDPDCRLLTLLGPGGFGKSRLGIRLGEIVQTEADFFPDGVFFAALAGLEDGDLVVPAIAAALHFTFYEQTDQKRQLLNYLASKPLLLILDNAEHILDSALVDEILVNAPQVKIVVTSREALNLQQEWLHPINGLGMADLEMNNGETADAFQLFQQCARRARPGFDLEHEYPQVQKICRLVDGAPLAIELAAAWLRALPCAQIVQELEQSLDFLSTTLHNIPARHRSMRVVLEQSWDYLSPEEQRVFRQLSVFVGGFSADAAEEVAEASLLTLAGLVEKSVLQLRRDGRYRIHALLRQLGAEKLADHPHELALVQTRHCEYYTAFLRDRRRSIAGPDQKAVLTDVQDELDNVRTAWASAARDSRIEEMDAALPALFRFLWTRGRYADGERLTTLALNEIDAAELNEEQRPFLILLTARKAQFVAARGAYQQALAMLDEAMAAAKRVENMPGQALCTYAIGTIARCLWETDRAAKNLGIAYAIYQKLNDATGTAEAALALGMVEVDLKQNLVAGRRFIEEGLQLFRELGDLANMAYALDSIALIQFILGESDDAERRYREALALARDVGHRLVIAKCIGGLSAVAWLRGQWELAIHLMQERLGRMQELAFENDVYESLRMLLTLYAHAGRYDDVMSLVETHPQMQNFYATAQAQISIGSYAEAMGSLLARTAEQSAAGDTNSLTENLIAWAMLLASDCVLVKSRPESGETVAFVGAERAAKAMDILSFLCTYERCYAASRNRARTLLAELQGDVLIPEYDAQNIHHGAHAIEALAQEMLTLRLG